MGEKALQRANRAAGFDVELIEDRNFYIPQQSVLGFVDAMAKSTGQADLGLLLVPSMDVGAYGSFGRYISEASTLGQAIERSIAALQFHSTFDSLKVKASRSEVHFSYKFALAGSQGYEVVACAAAGELLSLFWGYLSDSWRPLRVELDIPAPRNTASFEDVFRCPVLFDAPAVAVVVEPYRLMAASKRPSRSVTTLADVARDRPGGAPQDFRDIAIAQIRAQLSMGTVSIEAAAQAMNKSVRTFQRELRQAGTDFRGLTKTVRLQRATEMLQDQTVPITSISEDLGYSSPTGFSRAFRNATGFCPREYRTSQLGLDADRLGHEVWPMSVGIGQPVWESLEEP